jgi:hypothetical protein
MRDAKLSDEIVGHGRKKLRPGRGDSCHSRGGAPDLGRPRSRLVPKQQVSLPIPEPEGSGLTVSGYRRVRAL